MKKSNSAEKSLDAASIKSLFTNAQQDLESLVASSGVHAPESQQIVAKYHSTLANLTEALPGAPAPARSYHETQGKMDARHKTDDYDAPLERLQNRQNDLRDRMAEYIQKLLVAFGNLQENINASFIMQARKRGSRTQACLSKCSALLKTLAGLLGSWPLVPPSTEMSVKVLPLEKTALTMVKKFETNLKSLHKILSGLKKDDRAFGAVEQIRDYFAEAASALQDLSAFFKPCIQADNIRNLYGGYTTEEAPKSGSTSIFKRIKLWLKGKPLTVSSADPHVEDYSKSIYTDFLKNDLAKSVKKLKLRSGAKGNCDVPKGFGELLSAAERQLRSAGSVLLTQLLEISNKSKRLRPAARKKRDTECRKINRMLTSTMKNIEDLLSEFKSVDSALKSHIDSIKSGDSEAVRIYNEQRAALKELDDDFKDSYTLDGITGSLESLAEALAGSSELSHAINGVETALAHYPASTAAMVWLNSLTAKLKPLFNKLHDIAQLELKLAPVSLKPALRKVAARLEASATLAFDVVAVSDEDMEVKGLSEVALAKARDYLAGALDDASCARNVLEQITGVLSNIFESEENLLAALGSSFGSVQSGQRSANASFTVLAEAFAGWLRILLDNTLGPNLNAATLASITNDIDYNLLLQTFGLASATTPPPPAESAHPAPKENSGDESLSVSGADKLDSDGSVTSQFNAPFDVDAELEEDDDDKPTASHRTKINLQDSDSMLNDLKKHYKDCLKFALKNWHSLFWKRSFGASVFLSLKGLVDTDDLLDSLENLEKYVRPLNN